MRIVTFGEILLRLSPEGYRRLFQAPRLEATFGGAEANVALSLAAMGLDAVFVTRLPENALGCAARDFLRGAGVDTRRIAWGGERLGIYYMEKGIGQRAPVCVYDRAHSAVAQATPADFDWDTVFADADWFHFTGITPALSDSAAKLTEEALKAAKAHGLTVSVDLNFRKKLWSQEKAREVMTNLMQYVDICIGNEEDAEKVLGFKPEGSDVMSGNLELSGYMNIFGQMADRFGFRYIASSLRESHSASNNGWSACIMDGKTKEFYHSRKYTIAPIVDRVGGGDAFTSGLICGLLDGKEMKDALEFGTAAAALKHTIPGDVNLMTRAEVEKLAGGDSSGRVQR